MKKRGNSRSDFVIINSIFSTTKFSKKFWGPKNPLGIFQKSKRSNSHQKFLCNNNLLNSKRSQAGNIGLLVILGVAIAIIIIWLLFSRVLIKTSTVFCEETRYILNPNVNETELFENFNRELCKEDCIGFCSNLSYEYEGHYRTSCRNPRVTHACGCRCN